MSANQFCFNSPWQCLKFYINKLVFFGRLSRKQRFLVAVEGFVFVVKKSCFFSHAASTAVSEKIMLSLVFY